jgi:Protein of unknown function (DUF3300)
MTMIRFLTVAALGLLIASPGVAPAQTNSSAPGVAPAQMNAGPTAPDQSQQLLNAGQLDALVAPIALYPDPLIAEILMASTYPLEVVEAQRWVAAHKGLSADQLKAAVSTQSWDASVKSLTATPSVLQMMSDKLDWTQKLGDAVLAQQPDVMDAIQRLRQRAQANNMLASNKQQTVTTQEEGGAQVINIEPTDPNTVYVPYYDPGVVYGGWPYANYPPYYFGAPDYIGAGLLATGLAFGAGYALGNWVGGGYRWGGGFNWRGHNIYVNRPANINNANVRNWTFDPVHRHGVRYNNVAVAQKFAGARNIAGGAQSRMDFRGRGGQQALQPGAGNRPNIGYRPARQAINRPAGVYAPTHLSGVHGPGGNMSGVFGPSAGDVFGNMSSGNRAMFDSSRGFSSLAGGFHSGEFGGGGFHGGEFRGGGFHGGGFHGGGFGGGGFHGGGFHGGGAFRR